MNLAADAKQAVALHDIAVTYYNVLSRHIQCPAVLVAPGLEHYGIVALVEGTVLHDSMLRHLEVDTVIVIPVCIDVKVMHPCILAHEEMDRPERALTDLESVQLHIGATVEMDEMRTHLHTFPFHVAELHRHLGGTHRI